MSWKRSLLETAVWCAARIGPAPIPSSDPRAIFVLRNNDIGDLLMITPLFDALRRRFPHAEIVAGIGAWNVEVLRGNPHVSGIAEVNAPWHNRITGTHDPRVCLRYVMASAEVKDLKRRKFDVGIDVLGSPFGSLLLLRAGIPWRIGVRGYAGGHSATQQQVDYDAGEHVGRAALRFAELLGATDLPSTRPQLFLSRSEIDDAERFWQSRGTAGRRRIVIAPGGGHPGRAWPVDHFVELAGQLSEHFAADLIVIGGAADTTAAAEIAARGAVDLSNRLTLRQTFGVISRADLVMCNSSMAMHAAAAFGVHAVVLLGPSYESAEDHARQWGHGPLTTVLGRLRNRVDVWRPDEVVAVVAARLAGGLGVARAAAAGGGVAAWR